MKLTILLSTLWLHLAVASEPQYILWVSSVIQSHSTEKACLHLLNLNESVSLSIVLEYGEVNTTIFDQSVEEENFYACADFKVSQKSSAQLAFVTLLAKGDTLKIFERRSVALVSEVAEETVTFVQTDKPIYKPGENVQIRIVTLNIKFKPVDELYPLITLQDPQNNGIFKWENVAPFQNITQLSFRLISEPMFGDYSIVVRSASGRTLTHQFTVNRYVLPKFEVKVNVPQTVTISDEEFQVDACAKYTFGQPVQGKVQIRVCRERFPSENCGRDNEICEQFIVQLKNGCVSQIVDTKVFQFERPGFFMLFHVTVTATETGTGVQISEKASISITPFLGTVTFQNMDPFYRRGVPLFGTLKFSGPNNVPMVNKLLQLELNNKFIGNYTTDENGEAQLSIDTSDMFDPEFNLKAMYVHPPSCSASSWLAPNYLDAYFSVARFYSRTGSFLKIVPEPQQLRCNQQKIVSVHYSLNREAYTEDSSINFFYLMMAKGAILLSGQKEIRNKAWNGRFSFPISVSADLAPVAVMLVYTLHPSGEIVADTVKFQVEKCFKNKVSIKFSEEQGLPGSNTSLYVQAAPGSLCALRAVDKSVLLLKPEPELSADSVYNLLPNIELYGYFYQGLNLDDGKPDPCIPQKYMFYNGLYYKPVGNNGDGDTYDIVKTMGLKAFTNLHYRKPELCSEEWSPFSGAFYSDREIYEPMDSASPGIAYANENVGPVEQAITETVRTNFPETWIWDLVSVDSSGSANLSFLIPDTITRWETNGFCVNGDAGFGISPTIALEASQPFFVEMTLPFSIVRNEQSDVIVNVFSYLNTCAEISVQLEASQNFEANIRTPKNNGSEIIQAGERKTYVWTLTPKQLGKVNITVVAESRPSSACPDGATEEQNLNWKDTVVKSLLVEPEGIEKEMTQSFLIQTKGTKISMPVVLDLPNNVVEGSARAFFTVVGDILGLAMQNLENLLKMPSGAGDQNIALLASDTYVLDYLKSTEQLTEEVKSKAFSYLSNGYQKQLIFKNADGSYSMFWQRNQEGSIWLTALTFKTLERMKEYVFIDEQVQQQTLIWLLSKQERSGCFKSDDKLFNNAWEGEEEDLFLTAYIVRTFFEAGLNFTFSAVQQGLLCLEEALENGVTNDNHHAIIAYAFALAGKEKQVESLLQILDQSATKKDNVIYWEKAKKPGTKASPSFIPRALSAETEKTCYVLLAVISQNAPDLHYASKIVQWLAQQMNSHGRFSSIQDNDVCLLAITRYMKLTFSNGQNNVTFSSKNSSETFQVNNDNRLLVQCSELTKAYGDYTVDVEGQGYTFIQATLRYNVLLPKNESGFFLSLEMVKKNCSDRFQSNFDLTVTTKHIGMRNISNMVLVDVKMLSGFTPVVSSIEELENNGQVMKSEIKNDHVLFYLENVSGTAKSFTFSVEQSNFVSNIQPAPVMVYDYYETDEYAIVYYNVDSASVPMRQNKAQEKNRAEGQGGDQQLKFQGQENQGEGGQAGSRAKTPGGELSNLFRNPEKAIPSSRTNRMASNIFGSTEEPQNIPKRTDSPGGKGSGIFDESTFSEPTFVGRAVIFWGSQVAAISPLAYPNKPKDHVSCYEGEDSKLNLKAARSTSTRKELGEKGGREKQLPGAEPMGQGDSQEHSLGISLTLTTGS
ncbi:PREDICTED: ovostatin homolog 2-like [Miniopterus natalensis]|uniref:ovostatin homolog 2-like n=1 Tax=Miniopterus natalensis TaxID=291302 RepID=UPI0007A6D592|nr:PREDICTED: ovostatin homolog 2-like [Miniopterus natalensis]